MTVLHLPRVQVHALAGRKLMLKAMRGGKDIGLHRADSEKLLRARAASAGWFSINRPVDRLRGEGFRESRRCSRDTYPESFVNE